jgi:hypothetical protein
MAMGDADLGQLPPRPGLTAPGGVLYLGPVSG